MIVVISRHSWNWSVLGWGLLATVSGLATDESAKGMVMRRIPVPAERMERYRRRRRFDAAGWLILGAAWMVVLFAVLTMVILIGSTGVGALVAHRRYP